MPLNVAIVDIVPLLQEIDSTRIAAQLGRNIGRFTKELEITIRNRISSYYSVTPQEVHRRRIGKSKDVVKLGRNAIRGRLQYQFLAKPLHRFPFKQKTVFRSSRFFLPSSTRKGYVNVQKDEAIEVSVSVRRGKFKRIKGKKGYGAFFQNAAETGKWAEIVDGDIHSRPKGIYMRQQRRTWIKDPITRTPIRRLYGPSVVEMIASRLVKDRILNKSLNRYDEKLSRLL